jgi:uncharacterized membrane protein
METKKRSLAKAVSWRVVATLITSLIVFLLSGEVAFAVKIGLLDTLAQFVVYFFHERLWLRVRFGRYEPKDYRI